MKQCLILILIAFSFAFSFPVSSFGLTIKDAFESARKNSQTLSIQEEVIGQSQEHYIQARAGLLPKASLQESYTRLDDPNTRGANSTQLNQRSLKLNLVQPLFHGLREFHKMDESKEEENAAKYTYSQNEIALFSTLAKLYIQILSYQEDIENLKQMSSYTQKRIDEISKRVFVGRSRESELLNARSQVLSLDAQREAISQSLVSAQNQFSQLTALPSEGLFPLKIESKDLDFFQRNKLVSLEHYLETAYQNRSDLKVALAASAQAQANLSFSKTLHYPSLDFTTNYYLNRNGALEKSKWDAGLLLTIPLFEGFASSSTISESASRLRVKKLAEQATNNTIDTEVRNAYNSIERTSKQLLLLEQAFVFAEKSYKAQERDARNGLVPMIDVLQFYNSCLDIKRNLDKARYQLFINQVDLSVATGTMGRVL